MHDKYLKPFCLQISAMDLLQSSPWTADLLDWGLSGHDWYIVMPLYAASLKQWRSGQAQGVGESMNLYFKIFVQICKAVEVTSDSTY